MMGNTIKYFKDPDNNLMALLIRDGHSGEGIEFLTEDSSFQQVAYMGHPAGHDIIPHFHNKVPRTVDYTCETLIMKKGVLETTLYHNQKCLHRFNLYSGDVITLFSGGHGFKALEDIEMIEIKQGPFVGPEDKTRFEGE